MTCTHTPRDWDTEAGYEACMFCIEAGDCDGRKGHCKYHLPIWSRWREEAGE